MPGTKLPIIAISSIECILHAHKDCKRTKYASGAIFKCHCPCHFTKQIKLFKES